jgi:peptidyl-tRNA hydrolase
LYVITRRDLTIQQQMLQAAHAAIDFQHQHPEISKIWNKNSNYLIFLSVENENKLTKYLEKFNHFNLKTTVFREPDIGNDEHIFKDNS